MLCYLILSVREFIIGRLTVIVAGLEVGVTGAVMDTLATDVNKVEVPMYRPDAMLMFWPGAARTNTE